MSAFVKSFGTWGGLKKDPSQKDMCEICGKNPKYIENGFQHPFCGRTCARSVKGSKPMSCALRGCRLSGKATHNGFCSEAHAKEAVQRGEADGCAECNIRPQVSAGLCEVCDYRVGVAGQTRLREIKANSTIFRGVQTHFNGSWHASKDNVAIDKVYEVIVPQTLRIRHASYRRSLAASQTLRTYHSSQCVCDLGVNGAVLCDQRSCGICMIVKSTFHEFAFGIPHNTGRYGTGIYSHHDPAKADKFSTSCTSSPYRVMIACDVIVEAGLSPISPLGGDPIFVHSPDAIVPAYIIMYHK